MNNHNLKFIYCTDFGRISKRNKLEVGIKGGKDRNTIVPFDYLFCP